MTDFNWSQFGSTSGFMSFKEIGDSIAGELVAIRIGKDFNQADCPELIVRTDDGDITVTAGQKALQNRLSEVRPQVGERVGIAYSGVGEAKPGRAPAKLFTVQVRGADGTVRVAGEQTPAPTPTPAPAAAASSLI
jgi:hypothetical protein